MAAPNVDKMNACLEPFCTQTVVAKRLCSKHYQWYRVNGGVENLRSGAYTVAKESFPSKLVLLCAQSGCSISVGAPRPDYRKYDESIVPAGLCRFHRAQSYHKAKREGLLGGSCIIDGCGEVVYYKNNELCGGHGKKLVTYKLTIQELQILDKKTCFVCGSDENLHIDHNHTTGKVRGVLCNNHNLALGLLRDNISHMKALITYLEATP